MFLLLFCFNNFCLFVFVCLHNQQHPSNQPSCHSSTNLFIHSVVHSFIQTTKQTTIHPTKQLTKTTVSETNRPSNNYQANLIIIPEISSTPSQQPTPVIPGLPNNRKPHYPLERVVEVVVLLFAKIVLFCTMFHGNNKIFENFIK